MSLQDGDYTGVSIPGHEVSSSREVWSHFHRTSIGTLGRRKTLESQAEARSVDRDRRPLRILSKVSVRWGVAGREGREGKGAVSSTTHRCRFTLVRCRPTTNGRQEPGRDMRQQRTHARTHAHRDGFVGATMARFIDQGVWPLARP